MNNFNNNGIRINEALGFRDLFETTSFNIKGNWGWKLIANPCPPDCNYQMHRQQKAKCNRLQNVLSFIFGQNGRFSKSFWKIKHDNCFPTFRICFSFYCSQAELTFRNTVTVHCQKTRLKQKRETKLPPQNLRKITLWTLDLGHTWPNIIWRVP